MTTIPHPLPPVDWRRGTDHPVVVGHSPGQVHLVLGAEQAEVLARVIARYSSLRTELDLDLDGETWDHAVVDLLAAKVLAEHQPSTTPVALVAVGQ